MANANEVDYGEAINLVRADGVLSADMSGPMVTGIRAVIMRVIARLTMRRGSLFYALSVGENVLDLENATNNDNDFSSLASRVAAEAEREKLGVLSARCRITRPASDPSTVAVVLSLNISSRTVGVNLFIVPGQTTVTIAGA
jgi:hypothetical protein